ncbi:hypothetical protein DFH06DRAFT_1328181 [Mycena polygramma]|nr:hypothetical protein DFH06DRAFT_1328181 [Mycena polygramma]
MVRKTRQTPLSRRVKRFRRRMDAQIAAGTMDLAVGELATDDTLAFWDGTTPLKIYTGSEWPPFVICPKGRYNPYGWHSGSGWGSSN